MPDLGYAQSADVIYFCIGGATRVYRLERFGHSAWSLEEVLFEDGPWMAENTTATTLTLGATTGNGITVTASAVTGIDDDAGFKSTDVGGLIRWRDAANKWTWLQIVGFTSTTVVTADIKGADASAATATKEWRLGDWSDDRGWPSAAGFVQQRLGLAATTTDPQKFWLSKSADIENQADEDVDGNVQSDSAISYRFAALKVNTILWMAMRKKPVIGTVGGEWTLRSDGAVLTPTDIAADFETSVGVAKIPPVEARNRLLYVNSRKRKLQEFADILSESGVQGFDSLDLSLLNDRIYTGGVTQIAYAQEPDSVVWAARSDGQCPTMTYQPDQAVIGHTRQILGGSFQGGNAVVESVAVIPGTNGPGQFKDSTGRHEVWVAVKREVNGSTVRYIECLEKLYNDDEDLQEEAFYVDSGLTLDNPLTITNITQANPGVVTLSDASTLVDADIVRIVRVKGMTEVNGNTYKVANKSGNTFELTDEDDVNIDTSGFTAYSASGECRKKETIWSGLDHLEGETVQVFADGAVQADKTVSGGSITLDDAASMGHVGLAYEKRWESLKLAFGAEGGTAVGRAKNLPEITLVLMETAEGAIQAATKDTDGEGTFADLDLRQADDIDADPAPLFSGEVLLELETGFDEDIRIILKGDTPAPATVLALGSEQQTNEAV